MWHILQDLMKHSVSTLKSSFQEFRAEFQSLFYIRSKQVFDTKLAQIFQNTILLEQLSGVILKEDYCLDQKNGEGWVYLQPWVTNKSACLDDYIFAPT